MTLLGIQEFHVAYLYSLDCRSVPTWDKTGTMFPMRYEKIAQGLGAGKDALYLCYTDMVK